MERMAAPCCAPPLPAPQQRPLLPRLTHTWPRLAIQPFLTCSPNSCSPTCSRGCRARPRPAHSTHAPVLAPCSTPRDQTSLRSSMRLPHARASRGAPVHVSHPHTQARTTPCRPPQGHTGAVLLALAAERGGHCSGGGGNSADGGGGGVTSGQTATPAAPRRHSPGTLLRYRPQPLSQP